MKFRQRLRKLKIRKAKEKAEKRLMLLDSALKELVRLGIAVIDDNKYKHSMSFANTVQEIVANPPSRFQQMKYGQEAGRKLISQMLALATTKPSKRDLDNLMVGYVCLKIHVKRNDLEVDKKLLPDLAYAVWYLNDHEPTVQEVEEWKLTSPT